MQEKKMIFLFSLPRSGSTLVQRVLAANKEVATVSEPWLLLNFLAAEKTELTTSLYNVASTKKAMTEFFKSYPGGVEFYEEKLNEFVYSVYENICDESSTLILDKTPRYHCIAGDIQRVFPEAKIIFLWRNPLSVCSSLIDSWGKGNWNLYRFYFDLFDGQKKLYKAFSQSKNCISINYESLILDGSGEWSRLFEYLGISDLDKCMQNFSSVRIDGMGDQVGQKQYSEISGKPVDKWIKTFNNPLRVLWAKKYIAWLKNESIEIQGSDYEVILNQLDSVKYKFTTGLFKDAGYMIYGILYNSLNIPMLKKRVSKLLKRERLYASR